MSKIKYMDNNSIRLKHDGVYYGRNM